MTEPNYFTSLVNDLNSRAARAVVSQMGVNSNALRHHLQAIFEQEPGRRGSFLADPVFEATFPWQAAREAMDDLSGQLLHPDLIAAMDQPPEELRVPFSANAVSVPPPARSLAGPQARASPVTHCHE